LTFDLDIQIRLSEEQTRLPCEFGANRSAVPEIFDAQTKNELECGPMPNVMAALPNISGALCSTPQSLADAHY